MIETPTLDWWAVAPEAILAVASIVVLLGGLIARDAARSFAVPVSLLALIGALVVTVSQFGTARLDEFGGQIDSDQLANIGRLLAAASGVAGVLFAWRTRPRDGRDPENFALILAAVCGMGLLCASGSLVSLFVGLELFSIALYVLCAIEAERVRSLEAGLKYLIIGGLSSAVLLYGSSLVYGATGTLDLTTIGERAEGGLLLITGMAMLIGGLAFKVSAAPLHWWTPDVYDGSPTSITAFMAAATKAAAFIALIRVLVVSFGGQADTWEPVVAGIATLSIVVGNLGALVQERLKRMLAYSSIAHAGYLLVGLVAWRETGVAAIAYALIVYVAMTLGAFALVLMRERSADAPVTWSDLDGWGWTDGASAGWLAALPGIALVILMLSLAGIPPTGGFFAKFALFDAAVETGYAWLAFVGVLGSVVSLGYYLRVPVAMYMRPAVDEGAPRESRALLGTLGVVFAAATMALAFAPGTALDAACEARESLLLGVGGAEVACTSRDR